MRKRVKSPLLCRKLLRNPSKRIKTSTPQLDREGLFLPVQAPLKRKTPVLPFTPFTDNIVTALI